MVDAFQELGEHLCNTSLCLKKVVDKGSSLKVRLVDLPLCYNLTLQGSFPRPSRISIRSHLSLQYNGLMSVVMGLSQ